MKVVIDANILFSALIKDSINAELIFHGELEVYSPRFLLDEMRKYEQLLLEKTHRTERGLEEFLGAVKERIRFIEGIEEFKEVAMRISPDKNDWSYFAAAIILGAPLWSNDKDLKKQDRVKIYSTEELLKELP